jgi:hypothetical protein
MDWSSQSWSRHLQQWWVRKRKVQNGPFPYLQYILSTWQSFLSMSETRENTHRIDLTRYNYAQVAPFPRLWFSFGRFLSFLLCSRQLLDGCLTFQQGVCAQIDGILYPQATFQKCKCHASLMNLSPEIADFLQRGISWHMELRWHMFFTWTGLGLIIHNHN